MDENGSRLSLNCTWNPHHKVPSSFHSTASQRRLYKAIPWIHPAISSPSTTGVSVSFWLLLTVAMLLCQMQIAGSSLATLTTTLCPNQCMCSNTTLLGTDTPVLTIDCSNGRLRRFLMSVSEYGPPTANITTGNNGSENYTAANLSQNVTFSLTNHKSNDTLPKNLPGYWDPNSGRTASTTREELPQVTLNLSFNNVSSLQTLQLSDWTASHVLTLNVSNNRIANLTVESFRPFSNLVSLDLSYNSISAFSPNIFQHLSSLKYLHLHKNQIFTIILQQSSFLSPLVPNLLYLDLSHNYLLSIPANSFSSFPKLLSLNLTDNNISTIDHFAFTGLPQLQYLSLSHNIISLTSPVFQNISSLKSLSLSSLPHLTHLNHDAFQGLEHLQYLNLSHNTQLNFLHQNILSSLKSLQVFDLSGSSVQKLSSLTFHNNHQLHSVYLTDVPLSCQCTNAWLIEHIHKNDSILQNAISLRCMDTQNNETIPLSNAVFGCNNVSIPKIHRQLSIPIGSSLTLQCQQAITSAEDILTWTTPTGHKLHYHNFHPNASQHLLEPSDVQPHAAFHNDHFWHQSSSYYPELSSYDERILILSDGSLFIDYILRTDAGSYRCTVKNAHFNDSGIIVVQFSYKISGEIKIIACIVGILCALTFFTLNVVYVVILWLARRLINKRRRETIRQMLETLNTHKSTQITRIYENYTCQLNRVRNRYHSQRDRLHKNYTMQVDRVKRGCSHQVEKVRENYNNRLGQLREYSSSQIMQIREMANNQIGRIRDYGSLRLDRLRETYKLQHQHMMKLLDTMNLDNCRSIVETECMRTESMMYDLDLLSQEDVRIESPFSIGDDADSEYNTATSSPMISATSRERIDPSSKQINENDDTVNQYQRAEGEVEEVLKVTKSESRTKMENMGGDTAHNDIDIEMNTVLHLSGNVQLEAKEVWTYGKGDQSTHKVYTKMQSPENYDSVETQNLLALTSHKGAIANVTKDEVPTKTMRNTPLPCVDLSLIHPSEWDVDYMQQDASPVKVWTGEPPPCLQCQKCQQCRESTTVNLYDADGEEEEEEKTETDTMV